MNKFDENVKILPLQPFLPRQNKPVLHWIVKTGHQKVRKLHYLADGLQR